MAGGIIASFVDVDARHRAEHAVALQADRTRAILDSVLVGIVTVGPQGIEWMNRSARRMFGGDLADFVNQPIVDRRDARARPPVPPHPVPRPNWSKARPRPSSAACKARDGREFWVVGNAVSTGRESTGRQLTYALLDIERRRQAEARVTEAQASLQRIIEAAPMAITLHDAHTLKIVQVNEVAARVTGHAPPQLIGAAPEDIFDARIRAGAAARHGARARLDRRDAARVPGVDRRRRHACGTRAICRWPPARAARPTSCCWWRPT